jgi:hypothetical protein
MGERRSLSYERHGHRCCCLNFSSWRSLKSCRMSCFLRRTRTGKCKTETGVSFDCVDLDILEVKLSSSSDLACFAHSSPSKRETFAFYLWMTF